MWLCEDGAALGTEALLGGCPCGPGGLGQSSIRILARAEITGWSYTPAQ